MNRKRRFIADPDERRQSVGDTGLQSYFLSATVSPAAAATAMAPKWQFATRGRGRERERERERPSERNADLWSVERRRKRAGVALVAILAIEMDTTHDRETDWQTGSNSYVRISDTPPAPAFTGQVLMAHASDFQSLWSFLFLFRPQKTWLTADSTCRECRIFSPCWTFCRP